MFFGTCEAPLIAAPAWNNGAASAAAAAANLMSITVKFLMKQYENYSGAVNKAFAFACAFSCAS